MRPHVVRQGEYLTQLAHRMGFDADAVWNHDDNRALRERRSHRDVLQPGDVLRVPEPEPTAGLSLAPHRSNRYRARVPRIDVHLVLHDTLDRPLAGKAYRATGMGRPALGTTDGDGKLTLSVPVHLREVRVSLPDEGREYQVMIGDMNPIEEPSGVRHRLEHLGHLAPGGAGDGDAELRDALGFFQAARGLPITGELNDATRDALVSAHGS